MSGVRQGEASMQVAAKMRRYRAYWGMKKNPLSLAHSAKNLSLHVCLCEAGSTLVASRSCTHGPRFSLLIRFLVSIKIVRVPSSVLVPSGS